MEKSLNRIHCEAASPSARRAGVANPASPPSGAPLASAGGPARAPGYGETPGVAGSGDAPMPFDASM